jgi:hypothetical protein
MPHYSPTVPFRNTRVQNLIRKADLIGKEEELKFAKDKQLMSMNMFEWVGQIK